MHPFRRPVIVFGLVALALRLGWVTIATVRHGTELTYPDEQLHWQIATHLVHDGEFRTDDGRQVARMPLYPLFLAPFAALGAAGVAAARVAQAIIGALAVVVGVRFAEQALGCRAAWLAGVLLAFDPYGVYFPALLLTETPFVLAALVFIYAGWCLWRSGAAKSAGLPGHAAQPPPAVRDSTTPRPPGISRRSPSTGCVRHLSLVVGLSAAATMMTRQSSIGWIAIFLVVIALANRDKWLGFARLTGQAWIIALALLPWGLRNLLVVGDYAWLSANGGVTLYDAQGPQADGGSDQSFLAGMPELRDLSEIERDHLLARYALDCMKSDKWRVASLAWAKFTRTWNPAPNAEGHRGGYEAWASSIYTVVVLAGALIGWPLAERRRRQPGGEAALAAVRFLLLPVLLFTLLHCVFIGSVRYRVPLMPMLATAAGALLSRRPADAAA